MIVTTGYEPSSATQAHAEELARTLGLPLVPRKEENLTTLRQRHQTDGIIVVSAKGARLETTGAPPFFFHPNTAAFRIKRLERGDNDTMLSACQIQPGDEVLDATLGLGADAIVFAHGVGESGRVVGCESKPLVAALTADGLRHYEIEQTNLQSAMRRVEVISRHHLDVLRELPDGSFDVVYFDPMFTATVEASSGIQPLRQFANESELTYEAVEQAMRVARRRVVLKEGQEGNLSQRFGFTPYRRRMGQVTYSYREARGGE
ncbi:class I SAM-dependent methyltransferase [Brevibacillus dissolubilis]|uniref:class I SAM-dependent methyltransferase n=1 Tax=Brevibacillus dissolubilis TaxID=1844116 RepID=UPI00111734F6|nr:class I SAM-dependent methyltransferase [Brevibacillus dissolubilis]